MWVTGLSHGRGSQECRAAKERGGALPPSPRDFANKADHLNTSWLPREGNAQNPTIAIAPRPRRGFSFNDSHAPMPLSRVVDLFLLAVIILITFRSNRGINSVPFKRGHAYHSASRPYCGLACGQNRPGGGHRSDRRYSHRHRGCVHRELAFTATRHQSRFWVYSGRDRCHNRCSHAPGNHPDRPGVRASFIISFRLTGAAAITPDTPIAAFVKRLRCGKCASRRSVLATRNPVAKQAHAASRGGRSAGAHARSE
jgi:hypothetical protein